MDWNDYQKRARGTASYCVPGIGLYPALGLCGEAGEVAEKIKKLHRDHGGVLTDTYACNLAFELGDVLWYVSAIAGDIGYTLEQIAMMNIVKVEDRHARNVVHGNGDSR